MKSILLLFLMSAVPFGVFAIEPIKSCEINVKYFYKTGTSEVKTYHLVAKSKEACVQKSKLYRENSTPQKVNKKEVSIQWTGK